MTVFVQLTADEMFRVVLDEIYHEWQITPEGEPIEIHRSHESDVAIGESTYQKILRKLEKEFKAFTLLPDNRPEGSFSKQWGYPSRYVRLDITDKHSFLDSREYYKVLAPIKEKDLFIKIQKAAALWSMQSDEKKTHAFFQAIPLETTQTNVLDKIAKELERTNSSNARDKRLKSLTERAQILIDNKKDQKPPVSANTDLAPLTLEFSDLSGEVILNSLFALAKPVPNDQNYNIIKYLIKNPNRFVTAAELQEKALNGKPLDKRLTEFAAQIGINKDLGKLFFDTSKDSIRLTNPVTAERMSEKNIKRLRIKAA